MSALEIVMLILLLVMGVFLIVSMLLQKSKRGLSNTISGGAETYYDKEKGGRADRILSVLTAVVGVAFVVIVFIAYAIQPNYGDLVAGNEWQGQSTFFSNF